MTKKEADELLSASRSDPPQKQRVFRGLQVLTKYDDNLHFACEHDQMFVGNIDETREKMTREDVIELALCGWFISQESWSHFV